MVPNHALLKQIFDRLLGRTREALEVEVPVLPQVSDADLAAPLAALLSRWHPQHSYPSAHSVGDALSHRADA